MLDRNNYVEDTSLQARRAEINIKLQRIRALLNDSDMQGVLLQQHPNFSWITAGGKNFVANCFDTGAVAILVTQTECHAFCNVIEQPRIEDEEQLPQLGFQLHTYPWQQNVLEEYVARHVSSPEKIITDTPHGAAQYAPSLIAPLRLQLTKNEMARYIHLGDVMSAALEGYLATVIPGMTEMEIAGGVSNALWKHGIEQVMHLVSADERACRYRHALPTQNKLKKNLIVSINGRYKGLITTVSRMVHIGKPPKNLLSQYHDCCEMESLTASKAAVGIDELELYNTLQNAYIEKGHPTMFNKHGQGGCQGYLPREYMITPTSHHIIKENQAYCFNPVIDGTKSEDSFIVTPGGPLLITRPVSFPKLSYTFGGVSFERPDMLVID